jgi:hypothetical protein
MPSNLPPANLPPAFPPEGLPNVTFGTVEHFHYNVGPNAQSASTTSSSSNTSVTSSQSFYTKHLSKHGPAYWLIHFFIALAATALFEFGIWLYHH